MEIKMVKVSQWNALLQYQIFIAKIILILQK